MKPMRLLCSLLLLGLLLVVGQSAFSQVVVSPSTSRILVENGTAAAPSIATVNDPTTGWYSPSAGTWEWVYGAGVGSGIKVFRLLPYSFIFHNSGQIEWTATDSSGTSDLILARDAANTLALKNGPNAQTFRVYGTTTGSKYLTLTHDGTRASIGTSVGALLLEGDGGPKAVVGASATTNRANIGGVINVNTTSAATTGTSEETLASYSLPSNAFNANGNGIRVTVWGTTAGNANNKSAVLYFGTSARTVLINAAHNNVVWSGVVEILRTGSNAQLQTARSMYNVSGSAGSSYAETGTSAITDSAAIIVALKATTPTAAGDLTFKGMIVEFFN